MKLEGRECNQRFQTGGAHVIGNCAGQECGVNVRDGIDRAIYAVPAGGPVKTQSEPLEGAARPTSLESQFGRHFPTVYRCPSYAPK